jgi:hypothetical protein
MKLAKSSFNPNGRFAFIGLRVTKLKDFRKKDGGILRYGVSLVGPSRFFQNVRTDQRHVSRSSSSRFLTPSKKSRAYDNDGQDSDVEHIEPNPEDDVNHDAPDSEDELPTTAAEPRASTSGHHPPLMFAPSASEITSLSRPSKPRSTGPIGPTGSTRVAVSDWQDQVSKKTWRAAYPRQRRLYRARSAVRPSQGATSVDFNHCHRERVSAVYTAIHRQRRAQCPSRLVSESRGHPFRAGRGRPE